MLLFDLAGIFLRTTQRLLVAALLLFLASCQYQPLYGNSSASSTASGLKHVSVSQVDSRVAQQVRNHLLFLFNGGNQAVEISHEVRMRVSWDNKLLVAIPGVQDSTSGTVTVTASYDLVELKTGKIVSSGRRKASASYDRTGQVFANERAERDAENRAARQAAEFLRLAVATDLNRT